MFIIRRLFILVVLLAVCGTAYSQKQKVWLDADTGNEDGNDRTYSCPLRKGVTWMREQGLPGQTIDKFMIGNPQRLFTWS